MAKNNYYYLVAGLKEYTIDSQMKGFDIFSIREEIMSELREEDRQSVFDLYLFYDLENMINRYMQSGNPFNHLGNFDEEHLDYELGDPKHLDSYLSEMYHAYRNEVSESEDYEFDLTVPFQKSLYDYYYDKISESTNSTFLKKWLSFDRDMRNIITASTYRRMNREITRNDLIGDGYIVDALLRSSAADFGIKGDVDYIEQLLGLLSLPNLLEREKGIDLLKWHMSDELTEMEYFSADVVMAYLVKLNIVYRWFTLDPEQGRELFNELIRSLSGRDILIEAEKRLTQEENASL